MKGDKFLIGIVAGIIVLVIAAVVAVLLRSPENEEYVADDTPEGVVHNYFLAIQRKDYEKAHSYLSDAIESKPDLDKFIRDIGYNSDTRASLQIGETQLGDVHSQVEVSITTYYGPGGFLDFGFDSNSYTSQGTATLQATNGGGVWKLTGFPYPYWGYDWDQARD